MAYDESLANRVRQYFADNPDIHEKKMFGGLCFLSRGNMVCGIVKDQLMARVGPMQYESCLSRPFAQTMDFTGRPMKGMVFVASQGFRSDEDLDDWLLTCLKFTDTLAAK